MDNKFTALGKALETLGSPPKYDLSSYADKLPTWPDLPSIKIPTWPDLPTIKMPELVPIENPMIEQLAAIIEELKKANERQEIELKNRATELDDNKRELKKQIHDNKIMLWCTIISTAIAAILFLITIF